MAVGIRNPDANITRILRLSVTGECNLSCFYCKPTGKHSDLMASKLSIQPSDVTKLVKIVGELGVRKVLIQGGEPLLRKDAANFVKSSYAHKGVEDVRLVTNGAFLKAFGDQLRKLGLKKVDINFDTLNFVKFQKITGNDSLYRVLDGVEKVERLHFSEIRINVFLLPGVNEDEIINFARLTKDRPLYIRFIEYGYGDKTATNGSNPPSFSIQDAIRTIQNYQALFGTPHKAPSDELEYRVPSFKFVDGKGKMSFLTKNDVLADQAIPRVVLNAQGMLINEKLPNKSFPVIEAIRKDAKDPALHRAIEKVMLLGPSASLFAAKKTVKKTSTAKRGRMAEAQL
ncbi:MAG: radical SAM protein [Bdellovibrionales bacterium]|nr:radical SAM protein [Bdellovibrionales bacterium]